MTETATFATPSQPCRSLLRPCPLATHLLVAASLQLGGPLGGLGYGAMGINALLVPGAVYLGFMVAFVVRRPAKVVP
jgi:hypothetical protein